MKSGGKYRVELNRSASILDFLTDDGLDAGEATAAARSGPRCASCRACAKREARRSESTMSCPVTDALHGWKNHGFDIDEWD